MAQFSIDECKLLIALYKAHPVLWKADHVDYGKRGPRYDALKRVKHAMPGREIKDITAKWTNLRTVYLRRRIRKQQYKKSGSGGNDDDLSDDNDENDDESQITDGLTFIDPYITVKHSVNNYGLADNVTENLSSDQSSTNLCQTSIEEDHESLDRSVQPSPTPTPEKSQRAKKSRKSSTWKEEESALKTISANLSQAMEMRKKQATTPSSDEYDIFGRFVATELRGIVNVYARDLAKKKIADVLFEAKWAHTEAAKQPSNKHQPIQKVDNSCSYGTANHGQIVPSTGFNNVMGVSPIENSWRPTGAQNVTAVSQVDSLWSSGTENGGQIVRPTGAHNVTGMSLVDSSWSTETDNRGFTTSFTNFLRTSDEILGGELSGPFHPQL